MSGISRLLIAGASRLAPPSYRRTLEGDLLEELERPDRRGAFIGGGLAVLVEIARSLPSLVTWRLRGDSTMTSSTMAHDPFHLDQLTPGATAGKALGLFRTVYLRALAVFLLVHFPLRILGHFIRSDESIGAALGSGVSQALAANGLLLVSWTLVEGALLAILVASRAGRKIGLLAALKESARHFPAFLAARVLFLIAVLAGLVALIVPGVLIACLLMLHGWLIFDRGLGPLAALRESARIVRARLRSTVGVSLPVAAITLVWVILGIAFVAVTLRLTAPVMPIFKIAPFTMTLMETGFVLFPILCGIVYANSASRSSPPKAA